jgi:hypothetical protein
MKPSKKLLAEIKAFKKEPTPHQLALKEFV